MAGTVNTPQRAFVYLRQSLDRTGSGAAVERQREDCLKLCAERGWDVARVFVDNDVSASSRKPRPEYGRMLEAVESGGADVVVAWHVDRLTRRLTELEGLIDLAQRTGLRIATVTGDVDLSTDAGRLVGRILASVARGEVERKGARQKRAQQQAAEQGRPAGGRRPFGYASDGVTVNEAEARHVRQAYADVMHGASLKSIAKRWNDAGALTTAGNAWDHTTVRRMLQNPRYAGLRTYRGEVVGPAVWPALVEAGTHETVRAILSVPERRTTLTTARKYLLPSIALCWKCGSDVMTGHTRHGRRVYVCRANKCISRKAEPVDEFVEAVVVERLSRPDAADLLRSSDTDELRGLQSRASGIRERLDDLATGLEEGILTLAAVRKSSARLKAELEATEAEIAAAVHTDALGPLVAAQDVVEAWSGLDIAQRRQVVDALMTVTLLKPESGRRDFDPETVRIGWRTP
ncbi:recombinase family protein [Nocardioides pinisoli]|uniref:Recombinase family protein n=1 Tax=Nocardioides pinisoli TaxID=2950279 RepID=A0ABT1L0F7_9ACTN|nr:recombinase family protein [Nocardioides pinisoli]MCP3422738.1 recombinase family protein [Nocardioides pinisoli]